MKFLSKTTAALMAGLILSTSAFAHQANDRQPSFEQSRGMSSQDNHKQQKQGGMQQSRQQNNQASHNWKVGNTLPKNYREQSYRVNNYQQHDLPKPAKNQR